jgi:hypothetical protein
MLDRHDSDAIIPRGTRYLSTHPPLIEEHQPEFRLPGSIEIFDDYFFLPYDPIEPPTHRLEPMKWFVNLWPCFYFAGLYPVGLVLKRICGKWNPPSALARTNLVPIDVIAIHPQLTERTERVFAVGDFIRRLSK